MVRSHGTTFASHGETDNEIEIFLLSYLRVVKNHYERLTKSIWISYPKEMLPYFYGIRYRKNIAQKNHL